MRSRARLVVALSGMLLPDPAWAEVPTASLPLDDAEPAPATVSPSSPPPGAKVPAGTGAASGEISPDTTANSPTAPPAATSAPSTTALTRAAVPVVPSPKAPDAVEGAGAVGLVDVLPSALVGMPAKANYGFARVNLQLKDPGSTVYVFPGRGDVENSSAESALVRCSASCSFELPHGEYAIRVVTAEGVASHGELSLQNARWVSVAPARRVARDLGFAVGAAGTAATILGVALLSDAICDSCTSTARNVGAAFGLGLGIPMLAIGWSLYYVHRSAAVEEQVLTQAAQPWAPSFSVGSSRHGIAVGAVMAF